MVSWRDVSIANPMGSFCFLGEKQPFSQIKTTFFPKQQNFVLRMTLQLSCKVVSAEASLLGLSWAAADSRTCIVAGTNIKHEKCGYRMFCYFFSKYFFKHFFSLSFCHFVILSFSFSGCQNPHYKYNYIYLFYSEQKWHSKSILTRWQSWQRKIIY